MCDAVTRNVVSTLRAVGHILLSASHYLTSSKKAKLVIWPE